MLVSFRVRNFRSIYDDVTFTMAPTKAVKEFQENLLEVDDQNGSEMLRTAAIFGLNGSGKSNLLQALQEMRRIVLGSHRSTHGEEIQFEPFALVSKNEFHDTKFEIDFFQDGERYQYSFSFDAQRVLSEQLYVGQGRRRQHWFTRQFDNRKKLYRWKFGAKFIGEKESIKNRTLENVLFIAKAAHDNHDQAKPILDFFRTGLSVVVGQQQSYDLSREMLKDKKLRDHLVAFLQAANTGVDDIRFDLSELKSVHKIPGTRKTVTFDFSQGESIGTNRLLGLSGFIIAAASRGSTLFIDELDDSFHIKLVEFLIELFHDSRFNKHNAQLIFTTHSPSVLETNKFRRDEIWFAEKNAMNETSLYRLSEITKHGDYEPVRKGHSIPKGILEGKYYKSPEYGRPKVPPKQLNLFWDED